MLIYIRILQQRIEYCRHETTQVFERELLCWDMNTQQSHNATRILLISFYFVQKTVKCCLFFTFRYCYYYYFVEIDFALAKR